MSIKINRQKIVVENAEISILIAGKGETVVLIPSWARGADDFFDLMRVLANSGYKAIAIDPRGVGESKGSLAGATLDDMAADVAGVITALDTAPVHVLGHAYGNKIARFVAADYPRLVKSVILLAAGGEVKPDPVAFAAFKKAVIENVSEEEWLLAMKQSHFFGAIDPRVWRTGWYPQVAQAQLSVSKSTLRDDWWRAGTAPMLIIQGLDDLLAPPANGRILRAKLGDRVRLIELEHTAHALLPERLKTIAKNIINFISDPQGSLKLRSHDRSLNNP